MENSDNRSFRVVAFVPAYNEEDIIVPSLRYLIEQGVDVYLIDNWSTDSTHELASQFLGEGLLAIERFPPEGPPRYHNWKNMLARMEEIAKEIDADWFLLQGADEVHVSPWPGSTLKDAIMRVNQEGFNSIDHTVVAFHPVDNGFVPGTDFEAYFKHFEFSSHPAHFLVVNGWKNLRRPVSLAEFAGHDVRFQGRRIYPYKFLLKHYQIRSQAHGEKKILRERKPRWDPELKAGGWHSHYDHIEGGYCFLRSPHEFEIFDEANFNQIHHEAALPIIDWAEEARKWHRNRITGLLDRGRQDGAAGAQNASESFVALTADGERTRASLATEFREMQEEAMVLTEQAAQHEALVAALTLKDEAIRSLETEISERDQSLREIKAELLNSQKVARGLAAQLAKNQAELQAITRTMGWRALRLFGKLKYPYLLPVYRLFHRSSSERESNEKRASV